MNSQFVGHTCTESPMGPVAGEPLHGYVNLPQNERHPDDQDGEDSEKSLPPPLAKKDRSRWDFFSLSF